MAIGVEYNTTGETKCNNVLVEYYPCADITGCGGGDDPNSLSWDYQSCTEIIANIDTNGITDMFPLAPYNFTRLSEYCMAKWNVVPNPTLIPQKYNFTQATNVIYSNGLIDPWFPGPSSHFFSLLLMIQHPKPLFAHSIDWSHPTILQVVSSKTTRPMRGTLSRCTVRPITLIFVAQIPTIQRVCARCVAWRQRLSWAGSRTMQRLIVSILFPPMKREIRTTETVSVSPQQTLIIIKAFNLHHPIS